MFDSLSTPTGDALAAKPLFDVYDELLVPLVFEPYADDVARRLAGSRAESVLEIAAGTGAVTRALAASLPAHVSLTATDLVQPMLDRAISVGTARPVEWKQADVMALPFERESFDVVVCQFGVMFFEPKAEAFAEVHRVLRAGGRFVFSVWDALDENPHAAIVTDAVKDRFPVPDPSFLERIPYGYHDPDAIVADVRAGGFDEYPSIDRIAFTCRAQTSLDVATAFCVGTPLRHEIETHGADALAEAVAVSVAALEQHFAAGDLAAPISAQVVTVVK